MALQEQYAAPSTQAAKHTLGLYIDQACRCHQALLCS